MVAQTEYGTKAIEDIEVGDLVWAFNEETGTAILMPVKNVFQSSANEIVNVTVEGEIISATAEHPFWVQNAGWKSAESLSASDSLFSRKGETLTIAAISRLTSSAVVYNIEVEKFHAYFVGEAGIAVHNMSKISPQVAIKQIDLPGKIRSSGMTLRQASEFFGWGKGAAISKPASHFTREALEAAGWSKERIAAVAKAYRQIAEVTPKNAAAAARAEQLESLLKLYP